MFCLFWNWSQLYVENYFTSHGLACNLLHQNFTLVGTIIANQCKVSSQLKSTSGVEMESTKALYDHSNKIILLSFAPKRNRNVLIMSSLYSFILIIDCHKKAAVIMDYNNHKGKVDIFNENCREFNCLSKTNCWPMFINYNFINVANNNKYMIMRDIGKSDKKTDFFGG